MKSLGVMAAGIAHDFNNLLTAIIGQASLAADSIRVQREALQHIAACLESAQKATSLIQKVLAYTGHSYHVLQPINVRETIATLESSLRTLAAGKTVIRFDIAAELPEILADADEVRQVLRNLMLNAVEASDFAGGVIEIHVDRAKLTSQPPQLILLPENFRPGTYLRVKVTDTGAGMAPEIAERAFDPFFSTKFLGRGLGLAEVLGIMRAHSGVVRLQTAPSAGTSVELFFPARNPVEANGAPRAALPDQSIQQRFS